MPRRVLMVSNRLPPDVEGGAERVAWQELTGLADRGHEVRGLTLQWTPPGSDDADTAVGSGPGITRIPPSPGSRRPGNEFVPNPALSSAFDTLIADFSPQLMHVHNLNGLPLDLIPRARLAGIPVVATFHDAWGVCPKSILLKPDRTRCPGSRSLGCVGCLEAGRSQPYSLRRRARVVLRNRRVRRALESIDRLIFPSHHHLELYASAGFPRDRCEWLPNPAPDRTRAPGNAGTGTLELLYLGAIPDHKGITVLLSALARLPKETARLSIHGAVTPDRIKWLTRTLQDFGLTDRVVHRGWLPPSGVPAALATCDAVVVPSICVENSPLSLLEAMAAGRPVIASNVGGIPEIVEDGVTGFIFPAGDAVELAERIRALAEHSEQRLRMGNHAGRSVEGRGIAAHLDRLTEIYETVRSTDG